MSQYKLVVVPEQTHLSQAVKAAVAQFAEGGGCVLLSGAHLADECADLVGVRAVEEGEGLPTVGRTGPGGCYLPVGQKAVPVFGPWRPVEVLSGTETWAVAMAQQEPEKDTTDQPVVTARRVGQGLVVAAHGPLFANYFKGHYPLLRQFIRELVERMGVAWTVTAEGPARLELVTRQRDEQTVINLINRGSGETLSGQRVMVEELPPVGNVVLRWRGAAPTAVRAVPEGVALDWSQEGEETVIRVPRVDIHVAVVVE
jgi:hypothetical protein